MAQSSHALTHLQCTEWLEHVRIGAWNGAAKAPDRESRKRLVYVYEALTALRDCDPALFQEACTTARESR
jgi:hypothetical protein